jgi:hypothetical protein
MPGDVSQILLVLQPKAKSASPVSCATSATMVVVLGRMLPGTASRYAGCLSTLLSTSPNKVLPHPADGTESKSNERPHPLLAAALVVVATLPAVTFCHPVDNSQLGFPRQDPSNGTNSMQPPTQQHLANTAGYAPNMAAWRTNPALQTNNPHNAASLPLYTFGQPWNFPCGPRSLPPFPPGMTRNTYMTVPGPYFVGMPNAPRTMPCLASIPNATNPQLYLPPWNGVSQPNLFPPSQGTTNPFQMQGPLRPQPQALAAGDSTIASRTLSGKSRALYVVDEELGSFETAESALDYAKFRFGGYLKYDYSATVPPKGYEKITVYRCTGCDGNLKTLAQNKSLKCAFRFQVAEEKAGNWVVRIPKNSTSGSAYGDFHSATCEKGLYQGKLFTGYLPHCVKREIDKFLEDKNDTYFQAMNSFGPISMQKSLSKVVDRMTKEGCADAAILSLYCRDPETKDISAEQIKNYIREQGRKLNGAPLDNGLSQDKVLESRQLKLPENYKPRGDYRNGQELAEALNMDKEEARQYIHLKVTDEILKEFHEIVKGNKALGSTINLKHIDEVVILSGVYHLFHLMCLAKLKVGYGYA